MANMVLNNAQEDSSKSAVDTVGPEHRIHREVGKMATNSVNGEDSINMVEALRATRRS